MTPLTPIRKKALKLFALALLSAFACFYALFTGGWNHYIALGVVLLGFLGFVFFYSKAFDLWQAAGGREVGNQTQGDRS